MSTARITFAIAVLLLLSSCGADDGVRPQPEPEVGLRFEERDLGVPVPDVSDRVDLDCGASSCVIGERKCDGEFIISCEEDRIGCGRWGNPARCGDPEQICVMGECLVPDSCVDNDRDGYGRECSAGEDCDDSNNLVNPGRTEVCDELDNDCDGDVDEGFPVGGACTVGGGACSAEGLFVCDGRGGVRCDAVPFGEPEMCDGVDNDCDGDVDEGDVCAFCTEDIFEPNDAISQATPVTANSPILGYLCPIDPEFFRLETTPGRTYRIYATFPNVVSDLAVKFFEDGSYVETSDSPDSDVEGFEFTAEAGVEYVVEIVNGGGAETFFRLSLVDFWSCPGEDGFVPNQSIDQAATLFPSWLTTAWACSGTSDWYHLGEVNQGDTIDFEIDGLSLGMDLDLALFGDSDGDNVYEIVAQSQGGGADEWIVHTAGWTGRYFARVLHYNGTSGAYDVLWLLN